MLSFDPHPLAEVRALRVRLPLALNGLTTPPAVLSLLAPNADAPMQRSEPVREALRRMLRHGGYRPTGRDKPASEYLVRAAEQGSLGPINPLVDVLNVVSLHSGLPISSVDLERAPEPHSIGLGRAGESYVFNASGQSINLDGLLCLRDQQGPCANPVKDAERTKTHAATRSALTVIWGTREHSAILSSAQAWYIEMLASLGAICQVEPVLVA